jgi:hypothetical protein
MKLPRGCENSLGLFYLFILNKATSDPFGGGGRHPLQNEGRWSAVLPLMGIIFIN